MTIDEHPPARPDMTDTPAIAPIEPADESAVLRIIRRHMRLGWDSALPPPGYLTWLANAAAVAGFPGPMLGWKLTQKQEIRGLLLVTPFRNVDATGRPFHDLVGHNFFVDEELRGMPSFGLFHQLLALRRHYRLKATTANDISSKLWSRLGAVATAGADVELCRTRISGRVVAEAMGRAVPRSVPLLFRCVPPRREMAERLDRVAESLRGVEEIQTEQVIERAARLASAEAGPRLDMTADFLRWILEDPMTPRRLLMVRVNGRSSVVCLAGFTRGLWNQLAAISVLGIWSEGGRDNGDTIACVLKACLREAHIVRMECDVRRLPLPAGIRCRALTAPRRWVMANAALPSEDHWTGLDAL
jgi:hypothetical protein